MLKSLARYEEIQELAGKRTPVSLIVGFLGAGKTTILNGLLNQASGRRLAVLVNDFGEINIDAKLITRNDSQQLELANGCVCCDMRDDLGAGVRSVLALENPPEHILVETSGVADPINVICALNGSVASRQIILENVITVVGVGDEAASTASGEFQEIYERQIQSAYMAVLNRVPEKSNDDLKVARERLLRLAPQAPVLETSDGIVPIDLLLGNSRLGQSAYRIEPVYEEPDHPFLSLAFRTEAPLKRDRFENVMKDNVDLIYRAKGFINFKHYPRVTLYQKVGAFESYGDATSWGNATPATELVLIGPRSCFDAEKISAQLEACF